MTQTLKSLKTPLRYPGGKSRALSKLFQYIPNLKDYTEYREPFLGGGSVALEIGKRYPHLDIWVNDLYGPLYNFWRVLQDQSDELHSKLVRLKTNHPEPVLAKELFLDAKDILDMDTTSDLSRAVAFYVVNKCSFSGLTESSSFSKQASDSNFSMRGIDKLPDYSLMIKKWKITNLSYEELFCDSKSTLFISIPPMRLDQIYMEREAACIRDSTTISLLLIVIALSLINLCHTTHRN